MESTASEIENTIKNNIDEELKRSTAELKELMDKKTQEAVDRINGVYMSAINTLKQLELTDATIFDFFQKTGGNIRVYEDLNNWAGCLNIDFPNSSGIHRDSNPIRLKEKTKYKIIVMAIEIKDEGDQK
ncbi:hypothetical protein KKE60_05780 [Patescibacteria group bacterium]|nr:hypothetical protein [Patescibacteria group bacterium]